MSDAVPRSSGAEALSKELKNEIQASYSRWLAAHKFKPRYGQRLMIATVANALAAADTAIAEHRFGVVEAGTGIGKTVAYTLAAAPIAREKKKTLVISTATVALQEQLINKDLPDLVASAEIPMRFTLAKGRGRYLCLSKLDSILRSTQEQSSITALYPDELFDSAQSPAVELYQQMSEAVLRGDWSGDRDEWPDALEDKDWRLLTSDRSQCHNRRCTWVSDCSFFKARDGLQEVDCIVTNHDLVLADLALGGGAILPEPEDCLYVFDEAHHLADKAVQHFSSALRFNATTRWLQQLSKLVDALQKQWPEARRVNSSLEQLRHLSDLLLLQLQTLPDSLQIYYDDFNQQDERWKRSQHARFDLGQVPDELVSVAVECREHSEQITHHIAAINKEMQSVMEAEPGREEIEQWLPIVGAGLNRAESAAGLFAYYASANEQKAIPRAFWISRFELDSGVDFGLHSAPLLASEYLDDMLWSRCGGAVLTSATLTALGRFDRLQMHSGIPQQASFQVVPSPFDYASRAVLRIPREACIPSDVEQHTEQLRNYIERLDEPAGVLVLFMSRKQMQEVYDELDAALLSSVLLQDQRSKQGLLDEHMRRVDAGERSYIFGLASFAEGVDLPGDYCRHVVIAKLPFAVPDDPVASALTEWVEQQGRNAFMEISVPEAALRLVQACGRLLRNEADSGTVSLLDRRVLEKRYGRELLDALPPFRREIE